MRNRVKVLIGLIVVLSTSFIASVYASGEVILEAIEKPSAEIAIVSVVSVIVAALNGGAIVVMGGIVKDMIRAMERRDKDHAKETAATAQVLQMLTDNCRAHQDWLSTREKEKELDSDGLDG